MLFRLLPSPSFSFILFSILFLSSSFLIRSCDALRRRFFQRAKSWTEQSTELFTVYKCSGFFVKSAQISRLIYTLPFVVFLRKIVVLLVHALMPGLAQRGQMFHLLFTEDVVHTCTPRQERSRNGFFLMTLSADTTTTKWKNNNWHSDMWKWQWNGLISTAVSVRKYKWHGQKEQRKLFKIHPQFVVDSVLTVKHMLWVNANRQHSIKQKEIPK